MVGRVLTDGPARTLCVGLAALALTACATTPVAPVRQAVMQPPVAEAQPFSPDAPPRILDPGAHLQCVPYARRVSGIQIFGNANTWWEQAAGNYPRSSRPAPGAVLVTHGYRDASRGHVAVVTEVVTSRIIRVDHANWLNGGEITVGVPVMDVSPANDWSQVRVWHVPGQHWGARVYEVEGFIHALALRPTLS